MGDDIIFSSGNKIYKFIPEPSDSGQPYKCVLESGYLDFGDKTKEKYVNRVWTDFEGSGSIEFLTEHGDKKIYQLGKRLKLNLKRFKKMKFFIKSENLDPFTLDGVHIGASLTDREVR